MKKKKQRPSPNARAPGRSNSKGALSRESVERKLQQSKEQPELRVATPTNKRLQYLADQGIIVPDELPPDESSVPLDLTPVSSEIVGKIQSEFRARHGYVLYEIAKLAGRRTSIKRALRLEYAKFRQKIAEEKAPKYEKDDQLALHPPIRKLEDEITEIEVKLDLLVAIAEGYMDYAEAASREITRRQNERAQTG